MATREHDQDHDHTITIIFTKPKHTAGAKFPAIMTCSRLPSRSY